MQFFSQKRRILNFCVEYYIMITTQKVNKIYCRGTMHRAHRKNG